jgi:hypothetical protein
MKQPCDSNRRRRRNNEPPSGARCGCSASCHRCRPLPRGGASRRCRGCSVRRPAVRPCGWSLGALDAAPLEPGTFSELQGLLHEHAGLVEVGRRGHAGIVADAAFDPRKVAVRSADSPSPAAHPQRHEAHEEDGVDRRTGAAGRWGRRTAPQVAHLRRRADRTGATVEAAGRVRRHHARVSIAAAVARGRATRERAGAASGT